MHLFAVAVFFLIVTPGPGVLTLAGVGAAFGFRAGVSYLVGLFIGTNLVALSVVTGLAAIMTSIPALRTILFVASAAYLLYLAAKIAFSGAKVAFIEARTPPGIMGGVMLQLINPKAYTVNTTMFMGFGFWPDNLGAELLAKFAIMNVIWIALHLLWLWAGVTLHRLDLAPSVQRRINMAMAGAMLLVVGIATWAH